MGQERSVGDECWFICKEFTLPMIRKGIIESFREDEATVIINDRGIGRFNYSRQTYKTKEECEQSLISYINNL